MPEQRGRVRMHQRRQGSARGTRVMKCVSGRGAICKSSWGLENKHAVLRVMQIKV